MIDLALERLRGARNEDGGWGALPGAQSCTELTALATLALGAWADASAETGVRWLLERQRTDGAWPYYDTVPMPSWSSSLAILTLLERDTATSAVRGGLTWLVEQQGMTPGWRERLRRFLFRPEQVVDIDDTVPGWAWAADTFSWVEPTSWALLALKKAGPSFGDARAARRRRDGEAFLRDRVCEGGGWNYGNRRVLAQSLEPYPDTTALALLAMQDVPADAAVVSGSAALDRMLGDTESGLALSLAMLARRSIGRSPDALRPRLEATFERTGFLEQTRVLSLALLALADENPLAVPHG